MTVADKPARMMAIFCSAAFSLATASMIATRAFRLFTVAEILAVAAFLAGIALLIMHRRNASRLPMDWPRRLIVIGSLIGLSGLVVKLVLVLFGIGVDSHDMHSHGADADNRLLEHIHHLFFNVGFLFMILAALGLLVNRFRNARTSG